MDASVGTPDDVEKTIVSGSATDDVTIPSEELRRRLGIPADEKMSNYRDIRPIGLGGVGAVYSADEPGTDREVAIKILRPQYKYSRERIESFIHEARATAQIDHPNVVPVYRFGVFEDEGVYFSMKRVRGETLRDVLRKLSENHKGYARRYTLRRLVNIFLAACNGVSFANRNGILHGDLKPGNIMIGEFGEVLVMDWGMARYRPELDTIAERHKAHLGSKGSGGELSRIGKKDDEKEPPIGGTPVFMAPEHLTGAEKKLTETSEVYALGAILYSILTWRPAPYETENQPQEKIIRQVIVGKFQPPRKAAPGKQPVPRELEAICCKAMAKNPSRRYARVSDMIDEIQNYLDGYPVRAYSPSPVYRWGKWLSRNPIVPGILSALIVVGGGFGIYTQLKTRTEITSHFQIADYNAAEAFECGIRVRRCHRKLRAGGDMGYAERFALYREFSRETAHMDNANALALSSLSLLPRGDDSSPRVVLGREVFRNALIIYREIGDDRQLLDVMENCRRRWGSLYLEVLKNDPELLRLVRLTESRSGSLKVELPRNGHWRMELLNADGTKFSPPGSPAAEQSLPAQNYIVRFSDSEKGEFFFPVRILSGRTVSLDPGVPRDIPADLCYVGRGEVPVRDLVHFYTGGDVRPFLISRHEVSIGEYLEFLNSLPPGERLLHTPHGGADRPAWARNGQLPRPYDRSLPVTGISAGSAEAYCRWLGAKRGMKIRLPSLKERQKAAFRFSAENIYGAFYAIDREKDTQSGVPAAAVPRDDISVFGVVNAPSSARELLRDRPDRPRQVIGGSFPTGPSTDPRLLRYTASGDRDTGFRYVAELPENTPARIRP
ncbi:MAG: protein kinase [Lentisphaeria bacterium]|nr:protein kinase [Lentisphaeria bacterium]